MISTPSEWSTKVNISIKETHGKYAEEFGPSINMNLSFDAIDCSVKDWFKVFEKILVMQGFSPETIATGACELAFNEFQSKELMKKLYNDFDLSEFHTDAPTV